MARCSSVADGEVQILMGSICRAAGLKKVPGLLVLPPGVSGAFAVGSRRPCILISIDLLENLAPDELEAILAHEVAHIASRDIQVVLAAGLLRDLVAWNPFAHVAFRRLGADREYEADRRAAELTGKPLSVASSLVRVCELRQANKAMARRSVLAFFRNKGTLTRRVSRLLALSDAPAPTVGVGVGTMPYVVAALLAAVLGLQAGARIAGENGGAFALVFGAPSSANVTVWSEPAARSFDRRGVTAPHRKLDGGKGAAKHSHARDVAPDGTPFPFLLEGVGVRESDFGRFITVVNSRSSQGGLSRQALATEIRQSWRAVPLISQGLGSFGLYRIESPLLPPTHPRP
jgi:hypothetical protein